MTCTAYLVMLLGFSYIVNNVTLPYYLNHNNNEEQSVENIPTPLMT